MRAEDGSSVTMVRRGVGFAVHGRGFYSWDLERRRVLDMASELAPSAPRMRPLLPVRRRVRRERSGRT